MSNKKVKKKRNKLSQEILGLFSATAVISAFFYGFLYVMANAIVLSYCERNDIILNEMMEWTVQNWIQSISIVAAVICFVTLFLFLIGQKIAYLNKIIKGVNALHEHRLDYEMPIEGNNEFTVLAESINYLVRTERELQEKEEQMHKEKEDLIRAMSHDIRTPLTAIMSYSEYMAEKENPEKELVEEYIQLVRQKAIQIKGLSDQLLDGRKRELQYFENGKLLMQQLAEEWQANLEDEFTCRITFDKCTDFAGEFDVQELRRIFDNLASNVNKYADPLKEVSLSIAYIGETLIIEQKNKCRKETGYAESYKIGIKSIQKIAKNYKGGIMTWADTDEFGVRIELKC